MSDFGEPVPEATSFEQLLVDAARYRWLRDADPLTCDIECIPTLCGATLDAKIDEQRSALDGSAGQ